MSEATAARSARPFGRLVMTQQQVTDLDQVPHETRETIQVAVMDYAPAGWPPGTAGEASRAYSI